MFYEHPLFVSEKAEENTARIGSPDVTCHRALTSEYIWFSRETKSEKRRR